MGYECESDLAASGEKNFFLQNVSDASGLIVDVGANVGDYTQLVLENSGCEVVAFEPKALELAQIIDLKNRYPGRMTLVPKALGEAEGKQVLSTVEGNSELSTLIHGVSAIAYIDADSISTSEIEVVTLDQ